MGIFDFRSGARSPDVDMSATLEETPSTPKTDSETKGKTNRETKSFCRICQGSSSSINQLISPCNCKGTLAYVHFTCLERWLNSSSRISCELCHFQYNALQSRRYTLWESLRLWLRHPINWRHLQADLFILTLLSIVTVALVLTCILSLEYFIAEGKKYGVSQAWTKGGLNVFLGIIVIGYTGSMVFIMKEQLTPWYYWWSNTHNIQLRIDSNLARIESRKKLFQELTQNDSTENII
ncbi:hypothetical protein RUM44_011142 [Polyplax serrata]|uniref:RING-CH-type domain-containing protein n=1 Tax=Polyplax serrata TaxID=468196 RepID=A0ABR1AQY0_POLSC